MSKQTQHEETSDRSALKMMAQWEVGLRTPAWDMLWRQIFDEIADEIGDVAGRTGMTSESPSSPEAGNAGRPDVG